jgi:hypothetical protein
MVVKRDKHLVFKFAFSFVVIFSSSLIFQIKIKNQDTIGHFYHTDIPLHIRVLLIRGP